MQIPKKLSGTVRGRSEEERLLGGALEGWKGKGGRDGSWLGFGLSLRVLWDFRGGRWEMTEKSVE